MTAEGCLYAEEDVRDLAEKDLDKAFGKGNWYLDGSQWGDVWSTNKLPNVMLIPIIDCNSDEEKTLGILKMENEFYIREDCGDKWVYCKPKKWTITKK